MERILSVTELNDYIAGSMAHDPLLRQVCLWGEMSNFRITQAGHAYFSLKDEEAVISCVCFRSALQTLEELPFDGQRVQVRGYVSVYTRSGQMQFYVQDMVAMGWGQLHERFEALKAELAEQGYFAPERKRPLPAFPRRIGIVTSPTGAVLHDIAQVAWRRNPAQPLLLFPAKVQGRGAAAELAQGIAALDAVEDVDVIIVARGGGSLEDLWAMNERELAEAIDCCQTPVISAVGHETDFSIADFVADLRAPTPSAAAELVTPMAAHTRQHLEGLWQRMEQAAQALWRQKQQRLASALMGAGFFRAERTLEDCWQRLDHGMQRLDRAAATDLPQRQRTLDMLAMRLENAGPHSMLSRGYAVVQREGELILSAAQLRPGDTLALRFADGSVTICVETVHPH